MMLSRTFSGTAITISDVMRTNLDGVFNMTHPLWNGMRERKFGRIINISSINGQKGQFAQANYSAAKAGDIGFTKALAQEGGTTWQKCDASKFSRRCLACFDAVASWCSLNNRWIVSAAGEPSWTLLGFTFVSLRRPAIMSSFTEGSYK